MSVRRYLWGLFALLCLAPGVGWAQLCGATCLDLETLGAATVYDQETGASTVYDTCTYTDCTCIGEDASDEPSWICCQESTQHGWGSFGEGSCVSYSAGEVIVYGVEGGQPAPIPEPGEPSWSLLDWLGDLLLVDWPTEPDLRGLVLVDIWPEDHPREGDRPPVTNVADLFHVWGMFSTEDGADNEPTPTLDDPTERGGSPLQTEGDDETPSETPTDAPVEATPEPLVCPPNTTPAFGGLFCLTYWTPFGDWRVDWSTEPGLKDEPCGGKGQPPCPGAPPPVPACPPRHFVCPELGCCPHGDPGGMDPRTPPTDEG